VDERTVTVDGQQIAFLQSEGGRPRRRLRARQLVVGPDLAPGTDRPVRAALPVPGPRSARARPVRSGGRSLGLLPARLCVGAGRVHPGLRGSRGGDGGLEPGRSHRARGSPPRDQLCRWMSSPLTSCGLTARYERLCSPASARAGSPTSSSSAFRACGAAACGCPRCRARRPSGGTRNVHRAAGPVPRRSQLTVRGC
jgi:hypothetical protein